MVETPDSAAGGLPLPGRDSVIFGGSGFIGSALRRRLAAAEAPVTVLSRSAGPIKPRRNERWVEGDFADAALVADLLSPDADIYHLVSNSTPAKGNWDVEVDIENTVLPTLALLKASVRSQVRTIVYVSSGGTVYGPPTQLPTPETAPTNPISAYGVGKLMMEKYFQLFQDQHGLDCQILRVANPYGPGQFPNRQQGVVANLLDQALSGTPFQIWGDGSVARDFIHVDDVADAIFLAGRYRGPETVFNVGSGAAMSVKTIADDVEKLLGLTRHPRIHHETRGFDVPVSYLDIRRIQTELGWRPNIPWLVGLRQTADWISNSTTISASAGNVGP